MSLQGALAVAGTGLHAIERSLTVVSQNVANAGTTGYTREVAAQSSLTANGVGIGVRVLPATRDVDLQLQAATIRQNATVGGQQLTQSALQAIDLVQGTPGGSGDLASLIGAVQDAFTTLQAAPESQTQQSKVVATAQALTEQVNALSQAYTTARQDAQDDIVADVRTVKATLDAIGSQSNAIMRLKSSGQSTADLENQRDASLQTLSQMLDIRCLAQPSGDVLVLTPSGLRLPIHGEGASLATGGSNLAPGASYPASVPAITLGGVDVTSTLVGGRLGAAVMLRDKTLPTYQAELDEFAATLTDRFDQQGLRLFSDQTGSVPTTSGPPVQAGYVGYSAVITVNPAITAQPALVRDGTHPVPGSATGAASFVPNPSNGPSGFTAMITRVLKYALGTQAQDGVAQRESNTTGLGPNGTLAARYAPPSDLAGFAAAVVAAQSSDSAQASAEATTGKAIQSSLQTKLDAHGGVDIDTEMSTMVGLQNAYGANARVVSAVQSMWQQMLQMVP